jgi:hypothetical protein
VYDHSLAGSQQVEDVPHGAGQFFDAGHASVQDRLMQRVEAGAAVRTHQVVDAIMAKLLRR